MSSEKPTLICVVGPTAIGKTSLSIEIALALNTEIISADSRQFFKEMNIGTAVPNIEELQTVNHHFIHNRSIFKPYNVGDFKNDAQVLIEDLFLEKIVPRRTFRVFSKKVFYEPPNLKDYWKYLSRMQWQKE